VIEDLRRVESLLARAVRGLQHAGEPRYVYETEEAAVDAESALEALRGLLTWVEHAAKLRAEGRAAKAQERPGLAVTYRE